MFYVSCLIFYILIFYFFISCFDIVPFYMYHVLYYIICSMFYVFSFMFYDFSYMFYVLPPFHSSLTLSVCLPSKGPGFKLFTKIIYKNFISQTLNNIKYNYIIPQ